MPPSPFDQRHDIWMSPNVIFTIKTTLFSHFSIYFNLLIKLVFDTTTFREFKTTHPDIFQCILKLFIDSILNTKHSGHFFH